MDNLIGENLFYQFASLLILAGLCGYAALKLRQPLLVAFILVGFLAGPDILSIVDTDDAAVTVLAELGIALLLFMVGLKLDLGLIHRLGPAALMTGTLQILLTGLFGGLISLAFGYELQTALLTAIALSFSSTIIVVKLLSDKRAIDSLYGQMALGILIVQDIAVILAMTILSSMTIAGGKMPDIGSFAMLGGKIALLLAFTGLFIRFIAKPLTHNLARAPELMMIFTLGLAAIMAAISHHLGLSKELGGLLAGIALASTPYHNVIVARLAPLRDFLLLFFFVGLGAHIDLHNIGGQFAPALAFTLFVLIGKPVIIYSLMRLQGYRRRTGFMSGISLAQISEFSLIFIAMAGGGGLVSDEMIGVMTLVALLTIALSTYAITYNDKLFMAAEKYLLRFSPAAKEKNRESEETGLQTLDYDIIIFGLGRYGSAMAKELQAHGQKVMGIDFDPQVISRAEQSGIPVIYGDAADPEFAAQLKLDNVSTVVFAFHHYMTGPLISDLRRTLAKILREQGYKGHIAVTSHHPEHDVDLIDHGVDIVLSPFQDAALHAANYILSSLHSETESKSPPETNA